MALEEALSYVGACLKAITEHGVSVRRLLLSFLRATENIELVDLDTLGVMHPPWHPASLCSNANSFRPLSFHWFTGAQALRYCTCSHHLNLVGASFGSLLSSDDEWSWYRNFYETERKPDLYPRCLPVSSHRPTMLPLPILDGISSLAAHAGADGCSGSNPLVSRGYNSCVVHR